MPPPPPPGIVFGLPHTLGRHTSPTPTPTPSEAPSLEVSSSLSTPLTPFYCATRQPFSPVGLSGYPDPDTAFLRELVGEDTPLQQNDRISFFGDSITWLGGYIGLLRDALGMSAFTSHLNVTLINRGINGGKVTDVRDGGTLYGETYASFTDALAQDKPTIVVIYVGINDVWRGCYTNGTLPDVFDSVLRGLTQRGLAAGARLALATVSVIGERWDDTNAFDQTLDAFADLTRGLALSQGVALNDLRTWYMDYERMNNKENLEKGILSYDGVHPTDRGNMLLANHMAGVLMDVGPRRA
eukprot:TRINITY_DN318_c0_g1_i1.p1 TRINITY_DN318_c0_g1~~TRINITY_DN318_c0_g1_i1.p1  ORF type:complete len:316 (-),score=61.57 TRINITY_DN318_c0_g1_i1:28-921(-)